MSDDEPTVATGDAGAGPGLRVPKPPASPGPWRIEEGSILSAEGDLVAIWAPPGRDPQPWQRLDAEFIVRASTLADRERLGGLLEAWADFYNAVTPIQQADALLAFNNAMFGFGAELTDDIGWVTEPDRHPGIDVYTDLQWEDEDGHPQALVDLPDYFPGRVYPGAVVEAGNEHRHAQRVVLRVELATDGVEGRQRVLVVLEGFGAATGAAP